jgi:hypothetical protein
MYSMKFLYRPLQFLDIPFENFMIMNMPYLVRLWYFYGNNIYIISAIILCANLIINILILALFLRSNLRNFRLKSGRRA